MAAVAAGGSGGNSQMIKTRIISAVISLSSVLSSLPISAQRPALRVYADTRNNVHVVSASGRETIIAPERSQVGIDAIKVAGDKRTAGWLVLFKDPDGGSPYAGKLVVWSDGRMIRSFTADQTFWSWSFDHRAEQVAYHIGPTHGETNSHCELHDLRTGRLLAAWDGDLDSSHRPAWTKKLDH